MLSNMMTSEPLEIPKAFQSLVADSPARIFPLLEKAKELKGAVADCGLKCLEYVGKLDPYTSSLKIVQQSLFEDLNECYATFPKSGIMQNGKVYRASALDCNRAGNEHISLPTPVKSSANAAARNRYLGSSTYRGNLQEYIRDGEQDGTYPNPELIELLMAYPVSWTELAV